PRFAEAAHALGARVLPWPRPARALPGCPWVRMDAMQEPMVAASHHPWAPLTDLTPEDRASRSEELPLLAEVWKEEYRSLPGDRSIQAFNERLQREWAIETGIIERIYTLDRGITQLLIERGIDACLIPNDATDQPPELVANIIRDQESAVEFL